MATDIKTQADRFAEQLQDGLGANLVSLLLFGPAVREKGPRSARTLLIVRDASPRALGPLEEPVKAWVKRGHPPPLIFSEREWRGSADVFPIEIEDMREAHVLLRGENPLDMVETTLADLRRELEREVRGKLLQLRTEYAAAALDGKVLGTLLTDSAQTFFIIFRAVMRLVGRKPAQDSRPLVREVGEVTGIDPASFDWILEKLAGGKPRRLKPHDPVAYAYLEQIEKIAEFIDSFDATRFGGEPTQETSQ